MRVKGRVGLGEMGASPCEEGGKEKGCAGRGHARSDAGPEVETTRAHMKHYIYIYIYAENKIKRQGP